MGAVCCCPKGEGDDFEYRIERWGFQGGLVEPLRMSFADRLPRESGIVIVKLIGLKDIDCVGRLSSNPYVEVKLMPKDKDAGEQPQRSCMKTDTTNPVWLPGERFQFVVSSLKISKVLFSVYHHSLIKAPVPIGDAVLKLVDATSAPTRKSIRLTSPVDGEPCGSCEVEYCVLSPHEAASFQEHVVYEYERFEPIIGWGGANKGHLLPTDPGRWSSKDGKTFGNELEAVAQKIPEGFIESRAWCFYANNEDAEGWEYSDDFMADYWYSTNATLYCRRRAWVREVRRNVFDRQSSFSSSSNDSKDDSFV